MDYNDFNSSRIKELVSCEDAFEFYGFRTNVNGYVNCPFHNEKTGSMRVWKDHYYCFGCGARGDVIEFVSKLFNTSFYGAMRTINTDFSLSLDLDRPPSRREQDAFAKKLREIKKKKKELEAKHWENVDKYNLLMQASAKCKEIIKQFTPSLSREESVPDIFWECLKYRDWINFQIDNFDWGEELDNTV